MTTTYNTAPYFDDFNESKGFHQIMFRPGTAVQARELTQLQTILRDQIEKFGDHIFKHGSVVIPGNSFADLSTPYVKLQANYGGTPIIPANFDGKIVVGVTTGIRAFVQKAEAATGTDPVTLYVSYLTGSNSGDIVFNDSEEIYVEDSTGTRALVQASSATGTGSLAFINQGVYYINGSFVLVEKQSVVIDKYSSTPSCSVLLQINEQIVSADDDETLLDPAQGSFNFAAPGADRVQITLTLESLPLGSPITQNYIEIMRYNNGVLEEHAKTPKYSELEKSLARRTFDESGNYVVRGLIPEIKEHLKQGNNGGVFPNGDNDLLVVEVNPGKAYINGFEIEKIAKTRISIDKARTASHIKDTNVIVRPEYGQYIIVSNIVGALDIRDREVVDIYNDNDATNASATKIGTARVAAIDYLADDIATGAIYKLWITDLTLTSPFTIESAGGIRYGAGQSAYVLTEYRAPVSGGAFTPGELINHVSGRTATVRYWEPNTATLYAYKHDHTEDTPRVGDLVTGSSSGTTSTLSFKDLIVSEGQSGLVFRFPKPALFSLLDPTTNSYNLSYTVQKELTITTDSSGDGSVSVSSGEQIDPIEVGTFVAIGPSGVVQNNLFSLNTAGTTLTLTGGPTSVAVKVYAAVTKTNVSPKTKTVTTNSEVFSSPGSTVTLAKTDIIGITSIIDSVGDITANYNFWNGQTDYAYKRGTITLKPGAPAPSGSITVTYTFYQHSIAGDFFAIDSYPANILETRTNFRSEVTGQVFDLPACLDFRPSVGSDGEFTGTGSRRNDLIISATPFNSTLQFYVPRIDTLVADSTGKLTVLSGIPSENPNAPYVPVNKFALNIMYIPEYTKTFTDVLVERLPVERYTMQEIHQVSDRVDRVEDFVTLTAQEQTTINFQITDPVTGLDRFKTGYLVESFDNPLGIARTTAEGYSATFVGNTLQPAMEDLICELEFLSSSSSNYVQKGKRLMLPYTEEVFAEQNLSSRVTNINPFLVIRWDGILDVSPPSDDWVETRELPTIFETETETVTVNNYVPCPPPPASSYNPGPPTPPSSTYGGLYGETLNRGGEEAGVSYWVSRYQETGSTSAVLSEYLSAAKTNYQSGAESTFNNGKVDFERGQIVLTSKTEYSYNSSGRLVATETGTLLNGETFTRTK